MKKILLATALAVGLVGALAGPAFAGRLSVNAARNVLRYDSTELAYVSVDDYSDYDIEMFGVSFAGEPTTTAWFTVRVRSVGSGPLTAKAFGTGDCTGKLVTVKRKSGGVAIVRVRHTGDFDCTYRSVTVRWP